MKITQCFGAAFSPAGTTRTVTQTVLEGLGGGELVDITVRAAEKQFAPGELLIAAVPVFGGRAPTVALERLTALRGNGAFAAAVAVYGNRAFEDALLELKDALEKAGFQVVGAAAFVAQHSMAPAVAAGRPNAADLAAAQTFGARLRQKLEQCETPAPLAVPGNHPYRDYPGVPFKPAAGRACSLCGLCAAECPVKAIPAAQPNKTDNEKCISCMHCVAVCPQHARRIPALKQTLINAKLNAACKEPRQPELFL